MKYYIISGEASGDLHGATLVKHLCRTFSDVLAARVRGEGHKTSGSDVAQEASRFFSRAFGLSGRHSVFSVPDQPFLQSSSIPMCNQWQNADFLVLG